MNQKVYHTLEYYKILERLADYASCEEAKDRCHKLVPLTDPAEIAHLQETTADALSRLYRGSGISFSGVHNVNASLKRLDIGGTLNTTELLMICSLLEVAKRVKAYDRSDRNDEKTIKDAAKIKVTFVNDAVAEAKLVRYDGNTGLAALTVDLEDLETSTQNAITVMKTAGSNTIHKGSIVIALGSPLGTNYSILTGTITATNNEISTPDNNYSVYTTDIVASENGSGVLINMDGELVGVVMQSYSAASANTLTAVEISELMPVIDLLFADKEVPYFGVHISTVTQHIAQKYDIPKGVYIKKVEMDSPAMDAGLQSGDVIRSVAGQEVASAEQFREVLLQLTPKETYSVTVMREGTKGYKKITCKLKAGVLQ